MKNKNIFISSLILLSTLLLTSCEVIFRLDFGFGFDSIDEDYSYPNLDTSLDINTSFDTSENLENIGEFERLDYPNGNTYHDFGQNSAQNTFYAPSVGRSNILVIPVVIEGYENNATESTRQRISKAFFGTSDNTGWESVQSYFYKSSYGRLTISGTVTEWFDIGLTPLEVYQHALDDNYYGDGGTFYVLNKAVEWAKQQGYDMRDYDLNRDGFIDAVWLIYSCPNSVSIRGVSDDDNPFWAFTFWDYNNTRGPNLNNPTTNTYAWASYNFMNQGSRGIDIDAHTYIHEHGHVIGLDDYYDYDQEHSPLGRYDMQDYNVGDHNAFSKYAFGWVRPYLVTGEATITIKPMETSGQCIIVADPNASRRVSQPFDEYLILELITPTGLWEHDAKYDYNGAGRTYTQPGVRILHVDASLRNSRNQVIDTGVFTSCFQAYSNTPSYSLSTGSANIYHDLLALVSADNDSSLQTSYYAKGTNNSLFHTGDTFNINDYTSFFDDGKMNDGSTIPFEITFENVSDSSATISFKYL